MMMYDVFVLFVMLLFLVIVGLDYGQFDGEFVNE